MVCVTRIVRDRIVRKEEATPTSSEMEFATTTIRKRISLYSQHNNSLPILLSSLSRGENQESTISSLD